MREDSLLPRRCLREAHFMQRLPVFFFPDTQIPIFPVLRVRILFYRHANSHFSCFACPPSFLPTRRFLFSYFCVSAFFFTDTQISFFLVLRVRLLFPQHANSHFSCFACPHSFSPTRKFPFFLFLRVHLLFPRHANFYFLIFACPAHRFHTRKKPRFIESELFSLFFFIHPTNSI